MSQFYNALESLIPGEVVITITGNDGTPEPGVNNNFNIVTANATPQFKGTAGTETLDFGLTNLLLGSSGPSIIAGAAENTAVGILAGNGLTTGELNVFVGTSAGSHVDVGEYNTIIGANAGATFLGSGNTVVGGAAFTNAITANNNIIIGKFAGTNIGLDSNIMIGNAGAAPLTDANTIRIGTQGSGVAEQNLCFIAGITGATVTGSAVLCSSAGQLGTVVSSVRYKENVQDLGNASCDIYKLRPVAFNYKSAKEKQQYGLIAEEVEKVFPYLALLDAEGRPESVAYHELPVLLLAELKRLRNRVDELEKRLK